MIHGRAVLFDKNYIAWILRAIKEGAETSRIGYISFYEEDTLANFIPVSPSRVLNLTENSPDKDWLVFTQSASLIKYLYAAEEAVTKVCTFIRPTATLTFENALLFPEPSSRLEPVESTEKDPTFQLFEARKKVIQSFTVTLEPWGSKKTSQINITKAFSLFFISGDLIGVGTRGSFFILAERELPNRKEMIRDYNTLIRIQPNHVVLRAAQFREFVNAETSKIGS